MAQLMSDAAERRRLGENARAAVQRFNMNTVMQSWEQVLDACLGQEQACLLCNAGKRRSP
jgi:hypothetical protein